MIEKKPHGIIMFATLPLPLFILLRILLGQRKAKEGALGISSV
jgi:hypothetical protein